jgi:hypothetical protein
MGAPPPPLPGLQCEKCGAQVAPGSASCTGCGAPVAAQRQATEMAAAPQAVSEPEPEKASIWIPIKLLVVPIIAGLATAAVERNAPPGEPIGYWIGMMLFPTLIALAMVRFKPAKKMRTFSTVFFLIGLLGMGGTLVSHLQELGAGPQKTPKEIAQEAAGMRPVTESGTASEQKVNRVLREFLADIIAARKKHDADMAPLEPVLAGVYTPQSFGSKRQMEDVIAALNRALEIDGEMMIKIQRLPQEMQARVDASDLDPSDKEDLMRGVQKGYGNSNIVATYHEVRSAEEHWVAATVDLYTFGSRHASRIQTTDGKILIAKDALLSRFNAKFKNSRALRRQLDEANQRLAALQAAAMRQTGINKDDLGLK